MNEPVNRLDQVLVQRGLAESRAKAQAYIMAGDVLVDGHVVTKAGHRIESKNLIAVTSPARFVSRGGEKLQHALETFEIDVTNQICADLGASTGGFTDCLLQAGASRVFAVDVGYGQIDYRLRTDRRVVVLDRTNARYLRELPESVAIVTADLAFISLELVLDSVKALLVSGGLFIPLIKPQFEAGKGLVGKGGVVRDPKVRQMVLDRFRDQAEKAGFEVVAVTESPLVGPAGNIEYLGHLILPPSGIDG